ncbi:MAG: bifunctional DNA primase/polymerase [Candidatus Eisenbacteria bacterium]
MSTLQDAAIRYAELGYPVFPCVPGGKLPLTRHGFRDATRSTSTIEAWWDRYPEANVAIPTAGLLVVDVDGPDNPWPGDPEDVLDLQRGAVSLTPRGGEHYIFREPAGKSWGNTVGKIAPHVDTRADGGYILVPPSVVGGKPYRWSGPSELTAPAQLSEPPAWLESLMDALGANGAPTGAHRAPQCDDPAPGGNTIPAGQRNATLARLGGAMRRVGMSREEILSALVRANHDRCRPPLSTREVETIAASVARYEPDQVAVAVAENHWGQGVARPLAPDDRGPELPDPGPMPEDLLRAPGFVSEVMDHSLETAPYPNVTMAFAGALALQALLAGRKVRDPGDNRTNLYLLGLAHSSAGKDRPRKINTEILHAIGLADQVGARFASGEGIEDALFNEPCMLFQTDEIDGMLQSINKARDARHENVMAALLTLYSSANSIVPMRARAGKESPGAIDQPCLVVFGTAIPNHYYEALSERMLANGFFARMIVFECGRRAPGQEPRLMPLPPRVLETAKWWADFRCGTGNLENWHPVPQVVPQTDGARNALIEIRLEAEAEYAKAELSGDAVGTTVWGRVSEHARKLALVYAVSESYEHPEIGKAAAEWAGRVVMHQARRMLFMAQSHVADNPFHAECLKFLQKLRNTPGHELPHSVLLKRMKIDAKSFAALVATLEQRGDIGVRTESTAGRPGRYYALVDGAGEEGRVEGGEQ